MKTEYSNDYEFYNNSILIDIYKYPEDDDNLKNKTEEIVKIIYPQLNLAKSGEDFIIYKRHLKQIILNLVASVISSRPIATSRNKNNFSSDSRYYKVQYKYTYLTKTLDLLEALGYIEQKKGSNRPELKRNTRFWPTQKYIDLLGDTVFSFPHKEINGEVIRLRAKKQNKNDKKYAPYEDTDHKDIPKFRKNINKINSILSYSDISLKIENEIIPHSFLEHLQYNNMTDNVINIISNKYSFKILKSLTDNIGDMFSCKPSKYNYKHAYYNLHNEHNKNKLLNCYNIIPLDPIIKQNKFTDNKELIKDKLNNLTIRLLEISNNRMDYDYFYFDELNVDFLYKTFYRVFNIDFDHGGRFYNGVIQQIPKYLRKYILINGNKTVELDYSGFHLRLLYHLKGEDYQDDPYNKLIDKQSDNENNIFDGVKIYPEKEHFNYILNKSNIIPNISLTIPYSNFRYLDERNKYKIAQLILVNASEKIDKKGKKHDGEDVAIKGILDDLRKEGWVGINKNDVNKIIDKFKQYHSPIADYLYSGKSGELQNIDSRIINDIMIYFADKNIPTIPIHDSIIIEEQWEAELREQMLEVYKKHVGFYPVI